MRRARFPTLALTLLGTAACGAFAQAIEVDAGDAAAIDDAGSDVDRADAADEDVRDTSPDVEKPVDAGPDVIAAGSSWTSPNGATFTSNASGTRITGYTTANHPVIVPLPQLAIPANDYTVHATVLAPSAGATTREFGIVARIQPNNDCVVFGSQYGGEPKPFLTSFGPPNWNPVAVAGSAYTFTPSARHHVKLRVAGVTAYGKIWRAVDAEPVAFQVTFNSGWTTGRGAGFYTYLANGAVLESLLVTVP
jgi:hypothetical protein